MLDRANSQTAGVVGDSRAAYAAASALKWILSVKATPIALLLAISVPFCGAHAESATALSADTQATAPASAATVTTESKRLSDRYVSDDIYTFLHGGPGKQYRILGSVKAGTKVQFIELDASGKYAQIIDSRGRTAWIASESLQSAPSFRSQVVELQAQKQQLQHQLDNIDSEQARELKLKREQVAQLSAQSQQQQQRLDEQSEELQSLRQENSKLQQSLGTKEQDEQYRWWREGGTIAGVGLLLGLLLPDLPRPRRRKDRWMN